MSNNEIYQNITNQIIEQLEKGTVPWHKPWTCSWPANIKTGKAYRGINVLILSIANYSSQYWATFNQIKALGGKVRKGEKSTKIVFWNTFEKEEQGEVKTIWYLKEYRVFNASQCENLEHKRLEEEKATEFKNKIEKKEGCEKVINDWAKKPYISTAGDIACYRPLADRIEMPNINKFDTCEHYYSTLFHESVHSTGHKTRLAREGITNPIHFGSNTYSKEELIAEFGAAFLCGHTGIENKATSQNSISYIKSWLKTFKNDPKMAVQAASAAQKAVDFITK